MKSKKNPKKSRKPARKTQKSDPVNKPAHYRTGKIEVIDIMQDQMSPEQFRGYLKGNVLKYTMRSDHKGKPKEDLQKAEWYLKKLIDNSSETL